MYIILCNMWIKNTCGMHSSRMVLVKSGMIPAEWPQIILDAGLERSSFGLDTLESISQQNLEFCVGHSLTARSALSLEDLNLLGKTATSAFRYYQQQNQQLPSSSECNGSTTNSGETASSPWRLPPITMENILTKFRLRYFLI